MEELSKYISALSSEGRLATKVSSIREYEGEEAIISYPLLVATEPSFMDQNTYTSTSLLLG